MGYLPEERGLYKKLTVVDTLSYLASLKGTSGSATRQRATMLLERTGMLPHQHKKVEELSKGMAQLIQFIATILHDPDLVIFDEPFYGLDPVNTKLLKDMVSELRKQGKTIILSTHMMNEVEELCDRILMINKGRSVLYGDLKEIKPQYRTDSVFISVDGDLGQIDGVVTARNHGAYQELVRRRREDPRLLVRYGDFLAGPGGDPEGALAQYAQALIWKADDTTTRLKMADIHLAAAQALLANQQYMAAEARLREARRFAVDPASPQVARVIELEGRLREIRGR